MARTDEPSGPIVSALRPIDFADLPADLHDALEPRVERLGYLGDFFGYMAHQPAALLRFDQFTEEAKRGLGPGPSEVVALTAATRLDNDYERHQHERLAVNLGFTREWVAAVERLAPGEAPTPLDAAELAIQHFVLASIESLVPPRADSPGNVAADALNRVVEVAGAATAAGVALLSARFVGHALVSRACALRPPVPSIFANHPQAVVDAGA